MGKAKEPETAKLFVAMMYIPGFDLRDIWTRLESQFGPRESNYGPLSFSWSDYYSSEMGGDLQKMYAIFSRPISRGMLPRIKLLTNDIESEYSRDGRRTVNIDPGYLSRDKLVLATTKDFYHRIYLGDGIFGEVTLHYRKGRQRFFSWTYPDYREPALHEFLDRSRASFVHDLRAAGDEF